MYARNGYVQEQHHFKVNYKDAPIIEVKLTQLSLLDLYFNEHSKIDVSIKDLYLEGVVHQPNGKDKTFVTEKTTPFYYEQLNSEFIEKFGQVWNIDYLNDMKNRFREKIQYNVLGDMWFYQHLLGSSQGGYMRLKSAYIAVASNTIAHSKVCNGLFWLLLALRIIKVK